MAENAERNVPRNFPRAFRQLAERDVDARIEPRHVHFPDFANIEQHMFPRPGSPAVQFTDGNFPQSIVRIDAGHALLLHRKPAAPLAASFAPRIHPEREFAELERKPVDVQQTSHQRTSQTGEQFDRLERLQRPDNARQHAENPRFGAAGHCAGIRRMRIEAAVAGTSQRRGKDRDLSLESPDRAVDIRDAQRHAGIVRGVARCKIVAPVDHHIPPPGEIERVAGGETITDCVDTHMRIQRMKTLRGRLDLGAPRIGRGVKKLTMQIGQFHDIRIDNPQGPHPGCGEVLSRGRAESARTYEKHARPPQQLLRSDPEPGYRHLPRIPGQLIRGHWIHAGNL